MYIACLYVFRKLANHARDGAILLTVGPDLKIEAEALRLQWKTLTAGAKSEQTLCGVAKNIVITAEQFPGHRKTEQGLLGKFDAAGSAKQAHGEGPFHEADRAWPVGAYFDLCEVCWNPLWALWCNPSHVPRWKLPYRGE